MNASPIVQRSIHQIERHLENGKWKLIKHVLLIAVDWAFFSCCITNHPTHSSPQHVISLNLSSFCGPSFHQQPLPKPCGSGVKPESNCVRPEQSPHRLKCNSTISSQNLIHHLKDRPVAMRSSEKHGFPINFTDAKRSITIIIIVSVARNVHVRM